MATPAPIDENSIFVLVLGPVSIALLVGAVIYWMRSRRTPRP
jgi:Flp pilus assembly protein TadB